MKKFVSIAAVAFLFTSTMVAPMAPMLSLKAETINRDNNIVKHYVIASDYKISEITEYQANQISAEHLGGFNEISAGTQSVVDLKTLELHGFVVHVDNKNIPPVVTNGGAIKPVLQPSIVTQQQLVQILATQVHQGGVNLSLQQIQTIITNGLNSGTIKIDSNMSLALIIQQIIAQMQKNVFKY